MNNVFVDECYSILTKHDKLDDFFVSTNDVFIRSRVVRNALAGALVHWLIFN